MDPAPASQGAPGPEGLTDWAWVFQAPLIYRDRCWETCGGGYCCKPARVQRHFDLLRKEGVELPLLPGEYHYLSSRGLLQRGFEGDLSRHLVKVRPGLSFPVYRTVCRLDGICSDHAHRPVVCRIYPFAPVPDARGQLIRKEPVAVIDQFWDLMSGGADPCTIDALTPEEDERYRGVCAEILKDPINVFYLGAASIFKGAIRDGVRALPQLTALPEGPFFATWEKLLMFGQLYRVDDVLGRIARWYDEVSEAHGAPLDLESL